MRLPRIGRSRGASRRSTVSGAVLLTTIGPGPVAIDREVLGAAGQLTMRVFSYVVVSDRGFVPKPFHGTCTLACSKAQIRRSAALIEVDAIMQVICKSSAKHAA